MPGPHLSPTSMSSVISTSMSSLQLKMKRVLSMPVGSCLGVNWRQHSVRFYNYTPRDRAETMPMAGDAFTLRAIGKVRDLQRRLSSIRSSSDSSAILQERILLGGAG